jgi:membrane protease YdiL (CAAX protease family)
LVFTGELPLGLFLAATSFFVLVGQLPAYRVLMVWVYDRTGSLLVAMLMHASLTAATFVLGATGPLSGLSFLVYDVAMGAAWWAVVAAVWWVQRGRSARRPLPVREAPAERTRLAA